jgi:hypothetical protein
MQSRSDSSIQELGQEANTSPGFVVHLVDSIAVGSRLLFLTAEECRVPVFAARIRPLSHANHWRHFEANPSKSLQNAFNIFWHI